MVKKFLEMEFTHLHDRRDNIPISLELHNLPSTIVSICHVHGILISTNNNSNVQQLDDSGSDGMENCCVTTLTSDDVIKKVQFDVPNKQSSTPWSSKRKTDTLGDTQVQCWLCDGPHSFRQCKGLNHVKGVCARHP